MIHIPANITQLTYSDILCNKARSPFACKNRFCPFLLLDVVTDDQILSQRSHALLHVHFSPVHYSVSSHWSFPEPSYSLKRKSFLPCSPPLSSSTVAPSGIHPPISVELLPLSPACIKLFNSVLALLLFWTMDFYINLSSWRVLLDVNWCFAHVNKSKTALTLTSPMNLLLLL